ncbi:hypothetical protein CA13_71610 [Planctomycetes bacterium CA13]|uniref:Secreted protein n=1 Tax=Novipirellula herctigrandis TaxID=2527986 RepID=A0A5C5YP27_9BACT|nr:hypothetical protein CA13_71610 [Planctomycetes bacterium CA13]
MNRVLVLSCFMLCCLPLSVGCGSGSGPVELKSVESITADEIEAQEDYAKQRAQREREQHGS